MITDLRIRDYQSLADVQLRFGQFTVITGPTGAGKSAVMRAVQHVAFNSRGTGYIRRGQKSCKVTFGQRPDETHGGWVVSLTRSLARGGDEYVLREAVLAPAGNHAVSTQKFTKLGGAVPDQVAVVHALSPINFASQFDRPFLLTEPASQVARVLGELTNVSLVMRAAMEANKRRLGIGRDLATKRQDLAELRERAAGYAGLPAKMAQQEQAEAAWRQLAEKNQRLERLAALNIRLAHASQRAAELVPPDLPSLSKLEEAVTKWVRVRDLVGELTVAGNRRRAMGQYEADSQHKIAAAEAEYHAILVKAGRCPMCGQDVTDGGGHGHTG